MRNFLMCAGALLGLGAVGTAALAAHAIADPHKAQILHSAVQMEGWHALAILICGLLAERGARLALMAGAVFAIGTILFCGAIDADVFANTGPSMAAPAGGLLLMLGWLLLAISCALPRRPSP